MINGVESFTVALAVGKDVYPLVGKNVARFTPHD